MKYSKLKKQAIKFLEVVYLSETSTKAHQRVKKRFRKDYMLLLNYLGHKKLIDNGILEGTRKPYINLTPEGIDFYEENKKYKAQLEFNRVIALTGTIIALISLYNFLSEEATLYAGFKLIFFFIIIFSTIYLLSFTVKSLLESIGREY